MNFDHSIKEDFMRLTHNNEQAWLFVETFATRAHDLDDLIDGDKQVNDEDLIKAEMDWMVALSSNQFYKAHQSFLMPLLIMACNTWLDANKWEKDDDPVKRTHSDVLKSQYHEVIFAVVYLCGGWNAMREFTKLHREYQKENYHGNV
jgi:hypothetical protein